MTLVRWDPFRELEDMSERLNRVFSRPTLRNTGKENLTVADWMPTVDISETEAEYLIKAELPEVRKEDVKVTVENGVLTFQGERRQEKEEKGKKVPPRGALVRKLCPEFHASRIRGRRRRQGRVQRRRAWPLHLPKSEKGEAQSDRRKGRLIDSPSRKARFGGPSSFLHVRPHGSLLGSEHDQLPHVLIQVQPQYVALPVTGFDPKIAVRLAVPAIHDVLNR